jgi:Lysozyme like domain
VLSVYNDTEWNVPAVANGKWDMANWTKGKVTLAQAFGLSKAHQAQIKFPTLSAKLPAQAAASSNTGQTTTGSVPPPASGANYSQQQLQSLWIQAGGNPNFALIASAIAMAESGGNPGAIDNDSNGTQDRGLWQINSTHGSQSVFDPLGNARAAIAISSNGSNWQPWTTFNTGAYLKFM